MNLNPPKLAAIIAVTVVMAAALGSLAFVRGKPAATTAAHKTTGASSPTQKTTTQEPSGGKTSGSSSTTPAADTKKPAVNAACKLITLAVAQQLIGGDAKAVDAGNPAGLGTPATTVVTCTYTSASGAVQLAMRIPKNSLGVSENATVFGSERPGNAASVAGYGQSAFWDPEKYQLNVLGHNTWYVISRTAGGQPINLEEARAVADLLVKGF